MNPKHTTRARRTAAPSTGPAPTTDGAAGAGTPTAPMVPNAGEGITTDTNATTTRAPGSTPSTQTRDEARRALLRAILSTLDIATRAALLLTLAAWWRALVVLSVEGARALESARVAHGDVEGYGPPNIGSACIAAWSGSSAEELHNVAAGNGNGAAEFIAEVSANALEDITVMLGELGGEPPPAAAARGVEGTTGSADGLDGSRGAAVLRKCLAGDVPPGVRSRLAVSLMNAATASEHPRAALAAEAAVLVARDEGADPRHTLHLLFIAASEAAQLARRASIEGTQGARVDASANTLRLVARLVGGELRASVEALNIAVAAVEAFGGAR